MIQSNTTYGSKTCLILTHLFRFITIEWNQFKMFEYLLALFYSIRKAVVNLVGITIKEKQKGTNKTILPNKNAN